MKARITHIILVATALLLAVSCAKDTAALQKAYKVSISIKDAEIRTKKADKDTKTDWGKVSVSARTIDRGATRGVPVESIGYLHLDFWDENRSWSEDMSTDKLQDGFTVVSSSEELYYWTTYLDKYLGYTAVTGYVGENDLMVYVNNTLSNDPSSEDSEDILVDGGTFISGDYNEIYLTHILSGVRLRLGQGFDGTLKKITFSQMPTSAIMYICRDIDLTVVDDLTLNDDFYITFNKAVTSSGDISLIEGDDTIFIIPQSGNTTCTMLFDRGNGDEEVEFVLPTAELYAGEICEYTIDFISTNDIVYAISGNTSVVLPGFILPSGAKAHIEWGDGTSQTYTSSCTSLSHSYGSAFNGCAVVEFTTGGVILQGDNSVSFSGEVRIKNNVSGIATGAFSGNTEDFVLTLDEVITQFEIAQSAFEGCTGLYGINFKMGNNRSMYIRQDAFRGCTSLEWMNFPSNMHSYYLEMGRRAFCGCTSLRDFTATAIMSAADSTFAGCTSLEQVKLYDGSTGSVSSFGQRCFEGCTSLKSAEIYNNFVGGSAFYHCPSLVHIGVRNDNIYWHGGDGLIYRSTNMLYRTTVATESSMSSAWSSATSMNSYAYDGITSEAIVIPPSVTILPWRVAINCPNLKQVTFHANITAFSNNDIFFECPQLKTLIFEGYSAPVINSTWALTVLSNNGKVHAPEGATGYETFMTSSGLAAKGWTLVYDD